MGKSRKIVVATALIAMIVGAVFVGGVLRNGPLIGSDQADASAGATAGSSPVEMSPGPGLAAPTESVGTSADSGQVSSPGVDDGAASSLEPAGSASDDVANAQDAQPDYVYRAVTQPVTAEVPPDAGNEWQRAFEKEERDEAWAGPLEAEIRQSLEPEINLGRFYLANAECRATLCEIRLLARGSLQRAELDQYQSTIFTLPWAARLNPALSSGVDNGDRYESIWIFEKRPEPQP